MQRGKGHARGAGRGASLAAALALAALAWSLPTAPAAGERVGEQRRAAGSEAAAPRVPLGEVRSCPSEARRLSLGRQRLLAGRSGQRLPVRVRLGARAGERLGDRGRLRLQLVRVRREDPRHPGQVLGGETVARGGMRLRDGRGARVLEGLGPQPGAHQLLAVDPSSGARIAAARIDVLPQNVAPDPRLVDAAERRRSEIRGSAAERRPLAVAAGMIDHDLSFRPGSEASSALAVAPGDPNRVIAASNDFLSEPPAFISGRGLASGSIVERTLPSQVELPGGGPAEELRICCDPAVAADRAGNLWMAAAAAQGAGRIVVGRVPAGEFDFGPRSVGLPIAAGSSAQSKPAIAVRGGERISVSWIETLGGVQNVVVSGCELSAAVADCDDPDGWSDPVPVNAGSGLYSMPSLAFSPDGDLYASWWNPGSANAIEIDRCRAGENCSRAASWDEEAVVARLDAFDDDRSGDPDPLPLFCPIIAAPGGLVNPSPSVEVDRDGRVFVAYGDLRENADPGEPTRCTASGSDKTFDSLIAAGSAPGAMPGPGSAVRLSGDGPLELNDHFLPALSADPQTGQIEASFYSTVADRGGQRANREYVFSVDSGNSYSPPVAISDAASRFSGPLSDGIDYGDRQGADSAGGSFVPAWTDNRPLQSRDPDLYVLTPTVETVIDSGPRGSVPTAGSSFAFSTPAERVQCTLDGLPLAPCESPQAVGPLTNGPHEFTVRGTDAAGNPMDRSQVSASWEVNDLDPPETTITRAPKNRTRGRRPRFEFVADEPGARFQCSYDGERFRACRTPKRGKVGIGPHTFAVRAIDLGRNIDPTPAVDRFRREQR